MLFQLQVSSPHYYSVIEHLHHFPKIICDNIRLVQRPSAQGTFTSLRCLWLYTYLVSLRFYLQCYAKHYRSEHIYKHIRDYKSKDC